MSSSSAAECRRLDRAVLTERGVLVAVCEKGRIAGEQSGRNWGWCRRWGAIPPRSLSPWSPSPAEGYERAHRRRNRIPPDRHRLSLRNGEGGGKTKPGLRVRASFQIDSSLIGPDEFGRLLPGLSRGCPAALYRRPTAAPNRIKPRGHRQCRLRRRRRDPRRCAVRGHGAPAGAVSGVITERGPIALFHGGAAGGAWSRLFSGNLGMDLPQLKLLASVMRTGPVEGVPDAPRAPTISPSASGSTAATRSRGGTPMSPRSRRTASGCSSISCPPSSPSGTNCACVSGGASWRSGASRGAGRSMPSHRSRRCARSTLRLRTAFSMKGEETWCAASRPSVA